MLGRPKVYRTHLDAGDRGQLKLGAATVNPAKCSRNFVLLSVLKRKGPRFEEILKTIPPSGLKFLKRIPPSRA